ncbi:MAG: phenylalanine--tRNA ligase subunit beta [Candidatus Gastranaerophilales bacterium]|nr:phenylalanine--tRNA ligase subunit beta [Candidatus Gastranaerophilales bacterium]
MKVSLSWLNELVDLSDLKVEQIAHELTVSGLEVEEICEVKAPFTNIVTARIEKIDNHPNADKLHLVTVNNGQGLKTVVCGAQNIEEGQIIPYASVGSRVLDRHTGEQFTLTPAAIRGVTSEGMLCSDDELGVAERNYQSEDGILILNRLFPNVQIGKDVEELLGFEKDVVLNVAPTANRGDQFSVVGIARELSAIFNRPLKFSYLQPTRDFSTGSFKVEIKDEDVCKYYSIGILKDLTIKPSPDWMQKRLIASDIRTINNVVDITNYVLLEYGTPLHAFDLDKIGNYLCVRRANDGEKIVTLDEVERTCTRDTVLISTETTGVCIGGVFGGANSEVDENTKNLALEAAYFTPASNRRSARSVGYHSEASSRFEHGVDIEAVKPGLMRAMQLLVDYAGAKIEGMVETGKNELDTPEITLRYSQVNKLLGCTIEYDKCNTILERLGFELIGGNEIAAKYKVPSFRAGDVTREVDLIEEIARIYGYDRIAPTLPGKSSTPVITLEEKTTAKVHDIMHSCGLNELITSSLIGKPLLKQFDIVYDEDNAVCVENPQSEEFTMLRQTLSANMLNCFKYNYDNGQKNFWGYEIGKTYLKTEQSTPKNSGVKETMVLGGIISGEIQLSKWETFDKTDFYTVKGIMNKLLDELGISKRIKVVPLSETELSKTHNALHPYRSAVMLLLGKRPEVIGYYGQVNPELRDKLKLKQEAFIFKLDLDLAISAIAERTVRYKKLPQYPEVQRDLAVIISNDVSYAELEKVIQKGVQNTLFKGCDVFDIYQGEHIQDGYKSVACRIKMQDINATLTDETVGAQMANVRAVLKKTFADVSFREG